MDSLSHFSGRIQTEHGRCGLAFGRVDLFPELPLLVHGGHISTMIRLPLLCLFPAKEKENIHYQADLNRPFTC